MSSHRQLSRRNLQHHTLCWKSYPSQQLVSALCSSSWHICVWWNLYQCINSVTRHCNLVSEVLSQLWKGRNEITAMPKTFCLSVTDVKMVNCSISNWCTWWSKPISHDELMFLSCTLLSPHSVCYITMLLYISHDCFTKCMHNTLHRCVNEADFLQYVVSGRKLQNSSSPKVCKSSHKILTITVSWKV